MSTQAEPPVAATAERRVDERRPFRGTATVLVATGQEVPVRTLDISRSGLCIVGSVNPPPGLRFRIRMKLGRQQNGGSVMLEAEVQVVHSVFSRQEDGFRIGLRFPYTSPELSLAISRYMAP